MRPFLVSTQPESIGGLAGFAISIMEKLGAPGAGIAVALENLFPPLPSEVILPLAGFTASQGNMNLVAAIVWTTIGSVVGAIALYGVGAGLGMDRTVALAARLPLLKVQDIDRTADWFDRHGSKAVFFGRMIPIFRSLISIPAGVQRMAIVKFLALTATGSLLWNTAFILAGYLLGENWTVIGTYVETATYAVAGIVAVAVLVFIVRRSFGGRD